MHAVVRLGSYISRGVYTVSAPFHPFGGVVDIIVVQQEDGSFKSSPWYVRFGKFQGVLKAKEKLVKINVNGVDSDFYMHLDHKGEAHFTREVDPDDVDSLSFSGEDIDGLSSDRRPMKSKSCHFDARTLPDSITQIDVSNGNISRGSRSSRFLGFVLGRKSVECDRPPLPIEDDNSRVLRAQSWDQSEIAADLLEVRWSTNLASSPKQHKKNTSRCSASDRSVWVKDKYIEINDKQPDMVHSFNGLASHGEKMSNTSPPCAFQKMETSDKGENDAAGVFKEEDGCYRHQIDLCDEIPQNLNLESSNQQITVTPLISSSIEEVNVNANTLQVATKLLSEVVPPHETSLLISQLPEKISRTEEIVPSSTVNSIVNEICTQVVTIDPLDGSVKEIESHSISAISDLNHSTHGLKYDGEDRDGRDERKDLCSDRLSQQICVSESEYSEEDQLFFGEVDDIANNEVKHTESVSTFCSDDEKNHLVISREYEGPTKELYVPPVSSSSIDIPGSGTGDEFKRTAESLPNIQFHGNDMDVNNQHKNSLGLSLDLNTGSPIGQEMKEGGLDTVEADNIKELHIDSMSDEDKSVHVSPAAGDPSKHADFESENTGGWFFPFRKSSVKAAQSEQNPPIVCNDTESLQSSVNVDEDKVIPPSLEEKMKKKLRELTPTSEQLASLNLKEGPNTVTFTFSTSMLGPQQLEARMFLWKWDTRIVISDVDGTITKSDVLGQFMPMVGIDWSQTGVAHLFSAIKENGYQLLFLSARAISQAHLTRQFLFNLKQDGKALPDGPIIISPDGLFPSLFREVIRRAPHEFKIACLEDIKALFPPEHSPFYAGFGNRDTDEISYLKVGIPKGKIFIINPKGEVVVNRQIDTRSYPSLHELVHGMFPPVVSTSEQEDFNSWNFWKLSPPVID
ncbi:phosphatidate phosphatase PAH2-like [Impatiens glandulifera]|uniref:phosphatidate phosphatase PAH2-like n=1 Tax=Impatiens glandulifera TaxID=253017 RepID=UPI001FB10685|nr:phosphatidate phosphatase PAH2-like [Impatiens glandulifera]